MAGQVSTAPRGALVQWSSLSFHWLRHRGAGLVVSLGAAMAAFALAGSLESAARTTLAIVIAAALLWITEALPLHVTALAVLTAETVLLALPGRPLAHLGPRAFVAAFVDPVLLLFLGGFALEEALSQCSLDRRLVQAMLHRVPATAPGVLAGTIAVTGALSMWMSNTATAALMMAVMLPLVSRLDADDPFRRALLLAVPFAANIGGIGTPVGTPPNVIALGALQRLGVTVSFARWMALGVPMATALSAVLWWVLLRCFPAKPTSLVHLRAAWASRPEPVTPQQRGVLAIAGLTAVGWLTAAWHGIPEWVVALVPVIVLGGIGWLPSGAFRRMEWDVLVLMGGGLSLGFALQASGLAGWAVGQPMGPWAAVGAAASVALMLATFISHTAAAALLVPVVAGVGGPIAAQMAVAVALGVSGAMALPVSTPPNAIAFGSGQLRVWDMVLIGLLIGVLMVALATLLVQVWIGVGPGAGG
ncbi:SLC13 family permease [Geochorda subterranea]|uniref:DASS family sodium-coupled anion symporter n=1 Tax=Geochorda subterranea TaxID=3109564 RepID=A0ABZ1BMN3_9FIRM|nr:DASS family sodium-coupled anion symporter [Limnochorda sp. LNt]WRP13753.1 DASS family sodium-coupled anion symporter [Limnochorda sp. LNt]